MLAIREGYPIDLDDGEIVDWLMEHVHPSDPSLHKRLLSLKQGSRESMGAFLICLIQVTAHIKIGGEKVRKILVKALSSN